MIKAPWVIHPNLPYTTAWHSDREQPLQIKCDTPFFSLRWNGLYHFVEPVKYPRGVACWLEYPNGDVVLIQQRRTPHIQDSIECVRGGVDVDESLEMAVRREVLEETGLTLQRCAFLGQISPETATYNGMLDCFFGLVDDSVAASPVDSDEIQCIYRLSKETVLAWLRNPPEAGPQMRCGVTLSVWALRQIKGFSASRPVAAMPCF